MEEQGNRLPDLPDSLLFHTLCAQEAMMTVFKNQKWNYLKIYEINLAFWYFLAALLK